MKLSEALRYSARLELGARKRKWLGLRPEQFAHWELICGRFDPPNHRWGWAVQADTREHRAMILLFAACIAEDEGD